MTGAFAPETRQMRRAGTEEPRKQKGKGEVKVKRLLAKDPVACLGAFESSPQIENVGDQTHAEDSCS